jgi:hypothetical protein
VQAAQRLLADDPPDLATARQAMAQAVQQARRAADVVARLRRLVERPDVASRAAALWAEPTLRGALDLLAPEAQRLGVQVQWHGRRRRRCRCRPTRWRWSRSCTTC